MVGAVGFSALAGGLGAELSGGEFWRGAATGATIGLLNAGAHAVQNKINGYKFFNRLRAHYESKSGKEFVLSKKEFEYLLSKGKIDLMHSTYTGNNTYKAPIDFYESTTDLKLSFGTATVIYQDVNNRILYTGFRDTYDFDSKPWGTRAYMNEIITRSYNAYSSGKLFKIRY